MTINGKWERDALRPGIRLFLEAHPQKVADLGSDFGLVGLLSLCGHEVMLSCRWPPAASGNLSFACFFTNYLPVGCAGQACLMTQSSSLWLPILFTPADARPAVVVVVSFFIHSHFAVS